MTELFLRVSLACFPGNWNKTKEQQRWKSSSVSTIFCYSSCSRKWLGDHSGQSDFIMEGPSMFIALKPLFIHMRKVHTKWKLVCNHRLQQFLFSKAFPLQWIKLAVHAIWNASRFEFQDELWSFTSDQFSEKIYLSFFIFFLQLWTPVHRV